MFFSPLLQQFTYCKLRRHHLIAHFLDTISITNFMPLPPPPSLTQTCPVQLQASIARVDLLYRDSPKTITSEICITHGSCWVKIFNALSFELNLSWKSPNQQSLWQFFSSDCLNEKVWAWTKSLETLKHGSFGNSEVSCQHQVRNHCFNTSVPVLPVFIVKLQVKQ